MGSINVGRIFISNPDDQAECTFSSSADDTKWDEWLICQRVVLPPRVTSTRLENILKFKNGKR